MILQLIRNFFNIKPSHDCRFTQLGYIRKYHMPTFICENCGVCDPIEYEGFAGYFGIRYLACDEKYRNRERHNTFMEAADRRYNTMLKDLRDGYVNDERIKYLIEHRNQLDNFIERIAAEPFKIEFAFNGIPIEIKLPIILSFK